jgi:hypothetical protein
MNGVCDSQEYRSVRGPVDAFTVKQLPFVTVLGCSRPSSAIPNANTVSAIQAKQSPTGTGTPHAPQRESRPHSSMSLHGPAPRAATFSPSWAAVKLRKASASGSLSEPFANDASQTISNQRSPIHFVLPPASAKQQFPKEKSADGESWRNGRPAERRVPVEAAVFEENRVLKEAVSALRSMVDHERKLKKDVDSRLEELRGRCVDLEAAVVAAETNCKGEGKAWRANTKKMQNYGPLAPSSVTDPFAEEQRITREREQRLAEKERRRKEGMEQTAASQCAATRLHSSPTKLQ